jgi:cellulose synthase/poly-beta-1,6-N-acetylglucosamine synthase-like glycosyltransferase
LIHVFILALLTGLILFTLPTLKIFTAVLSAIYFIDLLFMLYIILKSLYFPQEISVEHNEISRLLDADLPIYTILCPLYKEAHVIPQFVSAISKLEWPKNKLDVMLLLEEDDEESIEAVKKMNLPSFVRSVVVPHSQPKTKPKACNYGLSEARGEYLVIFDAEDMPDPLQLKKAYLAFQKVHKNVLCLQAKLNYYNPHQNLLTRFFTAEYSLWFDVTLTGLQSINTSIPLGGTSNHFRTADLRMLQGWDPFNVTEDADLGMRLFKEGYKTAIIDSVTLEEANSKWGNWLRQRSRWIKGYMQTYLVHNRDIRQFTRKQTLHSLIFHLVVGGKIAFIIINPFLWLATISYFVAYSYVGPAIESLYPSYVFYMAVTSLIFGNFLFMYYYMIGCMKREQYSILKYTFLIPFYWIMISIAGFIALYQLFFKPHYWEKTVHGLHLLNKKEKKSKLDFLRIPSKKVRYTV